MSVTYPMMFELKNPQSQICTHCGVLEFTAEEGMCYVPEWVTQPLSFLNLLCYIRICIMFPWFLFYMYAYMCVGLCVDDG